MESFLPEEQAKVEEMKKEFEDDKDLKGIEKKRRKNRISAKESRIKEQIKKNNYEEVILRMADTLDCCSDDKNKE